MYSRVSNDHHGVIYVFDKLLRICEIMGERFSPSDKKIKIDALRRLRGEVSDVINELRESSVQYASVYKRQTGLLKKTHYLTRQIVTVIRENSETTSKRPLKLISMRDWHSQPESEEFTLLRDIHELNRSRYLRDRKIESDNSLVNAKKHLLSDRERFSQLAEQLGKIAQKLRLSDVYTPRDGHVSPDALDAMVGDINTNNQHLATISLARQKAEVRFHELLYHPESGIVSVGNASKNYIVSATDRNEEVARLAAGLSFKIPKQTFDTDVNV